MIINTKKLADRISSVKTNLSLLESEFKEVVPAYDTFELAALGFIQFKTDTLYNQFTAPKEENLLNPRLIALIWYSAWYFEQELNQQLVVTELFRTQERQDEAYKDNEKYQETPWRSVHQFGRGCDLRSRHMHKTAIEKFGRHINQDFPYGKRELLSALVEPSHIHLQVMWHHTDN